MNKRKQLQAAYELAFFPPAQNECWQSIKAGATTQEKTLPLLLMALTLHQRLPNSGYASQRALKRLAINQANARAFNTVIFLENMVTHLGGAFDELPEMVPGWMVRDIGLPTYARNK